MYYKIPKMEKYVAFVLRRGLSIIVAYIMLLIAMLSFYEPHIVSSDAMFWLRESKDFAKAKQLDYDTLKLSKLHVHVENFDEQSQKKLQSIQDQLSYFKGVAEVNSLFSHLLVKSEQGAEASMVGVVNLGQMDNYKLKEHIDKLQNPYANFVDDDFHTFTFYITSTSGVDITALDTNLDYEYDNVSSTIDKEQYYLYILVSLFLVVVLFKLLFDNYISSLSAIFVVSMSTFITFAIIKLITGINEVYVAMPFISISIVLVDYLYFYYRWHVSQYKADMRHALIKMLNRNITPALWTSLLTMLGLGSLVFVDSQIIQLLSLSVIISSIVGYIVNITFLPAMLSFFHIRHAHVNYAKICYAFAANEMHYNKRFLVLFLAASLSLLVMGAYQIYNKNSSFFNLHVTNEQVKMIVPYEKIDLDLIQTLQQFSDDLQEAFPESVEEVSSIASIIKELDDANTQTTKLDNQALAQALFYLDLYGLRDKYIDQESATITITLFDIDKNKLIKWLKEYPKIEIYFADTDSLLSSAMYDKTLLLSSSLFFALIVIGIITGWIFRSFAMAFVGFIVNAVPIVWFELFVKLMHIPLSIEMLIAMTITVGLASDATIHFAFKYFRSRYYGRTQKHSLEKMFFYAGMPVILGSFILVTIFAIVGFSNVASLQDIGRYSAVLILISLFTDLFILPVMLLFLDKFNSNVKDRLHRFDRH